jgi:hypothetical protein
MEDGESKPWRLRQGVVGVCLGLTIGWFLWFGTDGERARTVISSLSSDSPAAENQPEEALKIPKATKTPTPRPTATATIASFTTAYPTVERESLGDRPVSNDSGCDGYEEWIEITNDLVYRSNVLVDLLDTAIEKDNDFDKLNLDAMLEEANTLARDQRANDPPEELAELNDEIVRKYSSLANIIRAAMTDDIDLYNNALDEDAELRSRLPDDINDAVDEACGF